MHLCSGAQHVARVAGLDAGACRMPMHAALSSSADIHFHGAASASLPLVTINRCASPGTGGLALLTDQSMHLLPMAHPCTTHKRCLTLACIGTWRCNLHRPARNLQTKQVDVAQYLIPTRQSTLCAGGNCCNSDYRASPFSLQHMNSSLTTVGQQQMTTFYFKLRSDQQRCSGGCCRANIQKIWIDVGERTG